MLAALVQLPASVGYGLVVLLVAAETAGALVPGETALIVAASLAGHGKLSLLLVVACGAFGAIVGDNIGYLIGAIEFFGGIAILLGIATRWVAWLFVIYLIILTYLGHPFWMTGTPADKANFYKNLVIIGAFLMLAVNGGGAHSVDGRMSASKDVRPDYA